MSGGEDESAPGANVVVRLGRCSAAVFQWEIEGIPLEHALNDTILLKHVNTFKEQDKAVTQTMTFDGWQSCWRAFNIQIMKADTGHKWDSRGIFASVTSTAMSTLSYADLRFVASNCQNFFSHLSILKCLKIPTLSKLNIVGRKSKYLHPTMWSITFLEHRHVMGNRQGVWKDSSEHSTWKMNHFKYSFYECKLVLHSQPSNYLSLRTVFPSFLTLSHIDRLVTICRGCFPKKNYFIIFQIEGSLEWVTKMD
jgi:hypothetical protein